jgi:hypothetical protein
LALARPERFERFLLDFFFPVPAVLPFRLVGRDLRPGLRWSLLSRRSPFRSDPFPVPRSARAPSPRSVRLLDRRFDPLLPPRLPPAVPRLSSLRWRRLWLLRSPSVAVRSVPPALLDVRCFDDFFGREEPSPSPFFAGRPLAEPFFDRCPPDAVSLEVLPSEVLPL